MLDKDPAGQDFTTIGDLPMKGIKVKIIP